MEDQNEAHVIAINNVTEQHMYIEAHVHVYRTPRTQLLPAYVRVTVALSRDTCLKVDRSNSKNAS